MAAPVVGDFRSVHRNRRVRDRQKLHTIFGSSVQSELKRGRLLKLSPRRSISDDRAFS